MDDAVFFLHFRRMRRLTRALLAPLDRWEAELLARVRRSYGEETARMVRLQMDEAFIELVTTIDSSIVN